MITAHTELVEGQRFAYAGLLLYITSMVRTAHPTTTTT